MTTRRAKRDTAPEQSKRFRITVDGDAYLFDLDELKSDHELDLFNASRLTIAGIFAAIDSGNTAPFMLAALVYLARRQAGERVTYPEIRDAITYGSEIELDVVDAADPEAASPEAPAAG